jgi:hypothetical protein
VIKWSIPAGIPQYWAEYHDWYKYIRNHTYYEEESGPKVFALENLSFGFNVWLVACGLSLIGFLLEFLYRNSVLFVERQFKMFVIFLAVRLRLQRICL